MADKRTGNVPMHIRNAPAQNMADIRYSVVYKYPHDFPGHMVKQQYLPDEMIGTVYYEPGINGYERKIREFLSDRDRQLED